MTEEVDNADNDETEDRPILWPIETLACLPSDFKS